MSRPITNAAILCTAVAFAAIGVLSMRRAPAPRVTPTAAQPAPLYWYDPMHPDQHFDKPGKSPFMDMQLVPKLADQAARAGSAPTGGISIDSRVVQTLGIRLASVEQGDFARIVDTVGRVGVDEHRIEAVQARAPGWVERLEVRASAIACAAANCSQAFIRRTCSPRRVSC